MRKLAFAPFLLVAFVLSFAVTPHGINGVPPEPMAITAVSAS